MPNDGEMEKYVATWWVSFSLALFLLLPLDLLTTLFVVAEHGIVAEANPVMRFLLEHGLVAVTVANLLAGAVVVYLFHLAVDRFRRSSSSQRRVLVPIVTSWLLVLNLAGIVLIANNLSVWI